MRIVFAGTPKFAAVALDALIMAGHDLALVLTRTDRRSGRGMQLSSSEVKTLAQQHRIPVYQPASLRGAEALEQLRAAHAQAMVVAAYGLILPSEVLELFPAGCINIHASLLPRWRGAAPIQRALLAGDRESGISIMSMDEGLDTGPVYLSEPLNIDARETAASLHDRLAALGGQCITRALQRIEAGTLTAQPQATAGVSYAQKVLKEEAAIDWTGEALAIDRQIRAFNPFPGATTRLEADSIKLWAAEPLVLSNGSPGEILSADGNGIVVRCGKDGLRLQQLQKAGGRRLSAAEFLRGHSLSPGMRFGA